MTEYTALLCQSHEPYNRTANPQLAVILDDDKTPAAWASYVCMAGILSRFQASRTMAPGCMPPPALQVKEAPIGALTRAFKGPAQSVAPLAYAMHHLHLLGKTIPNHAAMHHSLCWRSTSARLCHARMWGSGALRLSSYLRSGQARAPIPHIAAQGYIAYSTHPVLSQTTPQYRQVEAVCPGCRLRVDRSREVHMGRVTRHMSLDWPTRRTAAHGHVPTPSTWVS